MKRTFPIYLAVVTTVLLTGPLLMSYSQSSPYKEQIQEIHVLDNPSIRQNVEALASSAGVPGPLTWAAFESVSPSSSERMIALDGMGADGLQRVRITMNAALTEVFSLTVAREGVERPVPPGGMSLPEVRVQTARYLATIGEALGQTWQWSADGPEGGGVYRAYWRSATHTALVTTDIQTGRLLFFRTYPNPEARPRPGKFPMTAETVGSR